MQHRLQGGRYVIQGPLGRGGMGAVYAGIDTRLGDKRVAIKEMSTAGLGSKDELRQAISGFKQEATMLAHLSHRNLPKVTDNFEEGGRQYLVMELVDGQTLEDLLKQRSQPFPVDQVVDWSEQLCDVLGYLHKQTPAIIFRDLKPANIMLDRQGVIKLIDFGIARHFKPGKQSDTMAFGSVGYAPPEQYGKQQTDARSDIYALAATLHQLLTLRDPAMQPFQFPPASSLNHKVPEGLSLALARALDQSLDNRWRSTSELRNALRAPASSAPAASTMTAQSVAAPPMTQPAIDQTKPAERPRAGLRGYLFMVLLLSAALLAARAVQLPEVVQSSVGDFTLALILYGALPWFASVLAYLLTRRPLAGFLVFVIGVWGGMGYVPWDMRLPPSWNPSYLNLENPFLENLLVTGAVAELVFMVARYRRTGTLVGVIAALAGAIAGAVLAIVRLGFEPSPTELAGMVIAALVGGALAALVANVFRRG